MTLYINEYLPLGPYIRTYKVTFALLHTCTCIFLYSTICWLTVWHCWEVHLLLWWAGRWAPHPQMVTGIISWIICLAPWQRAACSDNTQWYKNTNSSLVPRLSLSFHYFHVHEYSTLTHRGSGEGEPGKKQRPPVASDDPYPRPCNTKHTQNQLVKVVAGHGWARFLTRLSLSSMCQCRIFART